MELDPALPANFVEYLRKLERQIEELNAAARQRVNSPTRTVQTVSNRIYCATNRWVAHSDDNYGASYIQVAETAGTAADPLVEWEHQGYYLPAGSVVNSVTFVGRSTSAEVTGMDVSVQKRVPSPNTRWETGIDADAEWSNTELIRANLADATTLEPAWPGTIGTDMLRRVLRINHVCEEACYIGIYFRPHGTITDTKYWQMNTTTDYSHAVA